MSVFTSNVITDPSDFHASTVPKLFELDSLLRCHICKEFLTAPMLTSCGHSYCSVCIRKYLIHTAKCPICSKEIRESNLQRNVLLEQVVMSFKEMRPILLEKLGDQNSKVVPPKLQDASGDHNSNVNQEVIEIDDQDDDLEIVSETKKRKNEAHGLDAIFKRKKTPETKKASEAREVRMGTCPICSKELPLDVLESEHIDLCLNTPLIESSKPSDSSSSRVEPYIPKEPEQQYQKLNKLDFSSLSSNSLKQKLTKLELPSTGMRSQLEQRYNEYLILWNANCDSVQPKNPKVLRKQLAQWEASLKFKNGEAKQLDKEGWKELIKKAKGGLKKTVREDNYKKEEEGVDKETKKQIQIETIDIISTNEEKGESLEASNEDQNESVEPTQSSQERFFKD